MKDHRRISKNEVNKVITICVYRIRVKNMTRLPRIEILRRKHRRSIEVGTYICIYIHRGRERRNKKDIFGVARSKFSFCVGCKFIYLKNIRKDISHLASYDHEYILEGFLNTILRCSKSTRILLSFENMVTLLSLRSLDRK